MSGSAICTVHLDAAQFVDAACRRGERAVYFAFEESPDQIIRNMTSVGMHLARWVDEGLLQFRCVRPSLLGLEAHLAAMQTLVLVRTLDGNGERNRALVVLKSRGMPHSNQPMTGLDTGRTPERSEQVAPTSATEPYVLTLFVSGASDPSAHAIDNMREMCDAHLAGQGAPPT